MKRGVRILVAFIPCFVHSMEGSDKQEFHDTTNNEITYSIGLAGDVMLGRLVNEKINEVRTYSYPWGTMLPYLRSTDLTLINLETTLTTSDHAVPKVFNFKADPDKVKSLEEASIDVVNLANNHILDFGQKGLEETIEVLDKAEIRHVGAGRTINEARKPVIYDLGGLTVGIIGYTDNEPDWHAQAQKPGTNYIKIGDVKRIQEDLHQLKDSVDILIVSLHWGPNKRERPTNEFIDFAHSIIDAGADIIHGHSAHIFQGIEVYKNKLILYDAGDFVDDYAVDSDLRNDRSFFYIVECERRKLKKLRLIPVLISNMQVNKAPGKDFGETIARLRRLCADFGTIIEVKDDEALVSIRD